MPDTSNWTFNEILQYAALSYLGAGVYPQEAFLANVAAGNVTGLQVVNKFGRNPDVDTGTVPEDIWNGGGTYSGFPTGAPERVSIVSDSASDTGTITVNGLKTSADTATSSETVTLNGLTPVLTVNSWYRIHTAQYVSGAATTFNVGTITANHQTTTANVFFRMPVGTSQTNVAAYTIPAGKVGVMINSSVRIRGGTTAAVDGSFWVRTLGGSPRLRRPFTALTDTPYIDRIYGGIILSAGSDIMPRITLSSANNTDVTVNYDLLVIG